MNTRQNYDPKRAAQNLSEPTVESSSFDPAHPYRLLYAIDVSHPTGVGYYVPSELELIITALKHHRDYLAQASQLDGVSEQIDTLDTTIDELHNLALEGLALRAEFISNLARKQS